MRARASWTGQTAKGPGQVEGRSARRLPAHLPRPAPGTKGLGRPTRRTVDPTGGSGSHPAGAAPAILLTAAGTPAVWDRVLAAWPDQARPVAIALPGRPAPTGAARLARRLIDQTRAHIEAAGGASVPVIGYSLGARLALGLWAQGDVPATVLVSVNPGRRRPPRRRALRRQPPGQRCCRDQGTAAFVWPVGASPCSCPTSATPRPAEVARRRPPAPGSTRAACHGCLRGLGRRDAGLPRPAERAAPSTVHLLVGDRDKFRATRRAAHRRRPRLPGRGRRRRRNMTPRRPVPTAAAGQPGGGRHGSRGRLTSSNRPSPSSGEHANHAPAPARRGTVSTPPAAVPSPAAIKRVGLAFLDPGLSRRHAGSGETDRRSSRISGRRTQHLGRQPTDRPLPGAAADRPARLPRHGPLGCEWEAAFGSAADGEAMPGIKRLVELRKQQLAAGASASMSQMPMAQAAPPVLMQQPMMPPQQMMGQQPM